MSFWRTAYKIALRDLLARPLSSSLAMGTFAVAAAYLTAVLCITMNFRAALLLHAREELAGDLVAVLERAPTSAEAAALKGLRAAGLRSTQVIEAMAIVRSPARPGFRITAIKVVDPTVYPLYGTPRSEPPVRFSQALDRDSILASDSLMKGLDLRLGDTITIGRRSLRLAASIVTEPDRLATLAILPNRVIMSADAFASLPLFAFSHVTCRLAFAVRDPTALDGLRIALRQALPDAEIVDVPDQMSDIAQGLNSAERALKVAGLFLELVLASIVALAILFQLNSRLESIATLKVLGARWTQIAAIHLIQVLTLGLIGACAGAILGALLARPLGLWLRKYLLVEFDSSWRWEVIPMVCCATAIGILLVSIPVLIRVRHVRPLRLLRWHVSERPGPRLHFPSRFGASALRHGVANLARPGNFSPLAMGIMSGAVALLVGTMSVQTTLQHEFDSPDVAETLVLASDVGIDLGAIDAFTRSHAEIKNVQLLHFADARVLRLNGADFRTPRRWVARLTASHYGTSPNPIRLSIGTRLARSLHAQRGDLVDVDLEGKVFKLRIDDIHDSDSLVSLASELNVPADLGGGLKGSLVMAVLRVPSSDMENLRGAAQDDLAGAIVLGPSELRSLSEQIQAPVRRALQVSVIACILAGVLLMALAVANTRVQRSHEIAILKCLGARTSYLVTATSIEFAAIGAAAGVLGILIAGVGLKLMDYFIVGVSAGLGWSTLAIIAAVVTGSANAGGWLVSVHLLRRRPMAILRRE